MNTVPVATFNDLEPAQKLQQRLQAAGLPATIHDESKLERFWFMTRPLAAIHVEVPQSRYLETRHLITIWDEADGVLKQAVSCPECRSSRIEFPQLPRKFLMPTLFRFLMAIRLVPEEFYCIDCHYTWPTRVPVEPERDILGFPRESRWARSRKARQRKAA